MTANLTNQLLLVLVLVAVLGIAIGAALLQIKAIHSKRRLVQHHRISTEKLRDHLAELEHRHAALQRAVDAENQLLSIAKNKETQADAQQDALVVHSRLQAQRISSLEASLIAAEERGLRLQGDFESYKTHKQQELDISRRLLSEERISEERVNEQQSDERADNDLPVLNTRVADAVAPAAASVQAIQNMFEQELDIPALAESDLPSSINDIDFAEFANFADFGDREVTDLAVEKLLEDEADPVG
ncbi:MAG: hypothetical protein V3U65_00540 [Granulosicoccaceae bacterium]